MSSAASPRVSVQTSSDLAGFIAGLPKAELHLHFEGSLPPEDRRFFAARNQLDLPEASFLRFDPSTPIPSTPDEAAVYLTEFLEVLEASRTVLLVRDDFRDAMLRILARCKASGTRYAEIFFDPQSHTSRGIALETVVDGLWAGVQEGLAEYGVKAQLIMCFHRYRPAEDALELLRQSAPFRDRIVGVGLDDHEGGDWVTRFRPVFAEAAQMGYRLTAHCDVDQPLALENIARCITELKVDRIDHGLNVLEDGVLVQELVDRQIPFTACPTWYDSTSGPRRVGRILEMAAAGLLVSINSDDPGLFASGDLHTIYAGFAVGDSATRADLVLLARNSFRSAWLTRHERDAYLTLVDEYLASLT